MRRPDDAKDPALPRALGRRRLRRPPAETGQQVRPVRFHHHHGGRARRRTAQAPGHAQPGRDRPVLVAGDAQAGQRGQGLALALRRLALEPLMTGHEAGDDRGQTQVRGDHAEARHPSFVVQGRHQDLVVQHVAAHAVDIDQPSHAPGPARGEGLGIEGAVGVPHQDHRTGFAHTVQQIGQFLRHRQNVLAAGARRRAAKAPPIVGAHSPALRQVFQ